MITRILLSLIPALLLAALPAQDARPQGVVRVGTWNLEHFGGRKIDKGLIALQAHDPGSTVFFKDIKIKELK